MMKRMTAAARDCLICLALLAAPASAEPIDGSISNGRLLEELDHLRNGNSRHIERNERSFREIFSHDPLSDVLHRRAKIETREWCAERLAESIWPGDDAYRKGMIAAFHVMAANPEDYPREIETLAFMLAALGRLKGEEDMTGGLPLRGNIQREQARNFLAAAYANFRAGAKDKIGESDPALLSGNQGPGFLETFYRENLRHMRQIGPKPVWTWEVPPLLSSVFARGRGNDGAPELLTEPRVSPALAPEILPEPREARPPAGPKNAFATWQATRAPVPEVLPQPRAAQSPGKPDAGAPAPAPATEKTPHEPVALVGAAGLNWDLVGPGKPYHWGLPGSVKNGRPNEWNVYAEDGRRVGHVFINRYGVYLFHHNDSDQVFHYNGGTWMHALPTGATASLTSYARRDSVARRQVRDQSGEYRDAVMAPAGKSAEGQPAYLGPQGEAYETKVVERQEMRTYCRGLVLRRCYSVPVRVRVEEIRQARTPL